MEEQQIGWIAAIIVGGIAGWLAEQFMKSETWHHRSGRRQLADGLSRHFARRRLDRLFDRWFYRSLHPHRGGPRVQRRVSANLKTRSPIGDEGGCGRCVPPCRRPNALSRGLLA